MPKTSQAQIKAAGKYRLKSYETISAPARREERLNEQLSIGATRAGVSKSTYILDTLRDRLRRDGITPADLPPLPEADATPED